MNHCEKTTGILLGTLNLKLQVQLQAWVSVFTIIMAMVSNLSVIFIFWKLFYHFFLVSWYNVIFFNGIIFSFQNQLYFLHALLKIQKNIFIKSYSQYKLCLFSIYSNAQIVDINYSQGIYFPIFVVEGFSQIFLQLFNFFIKDFSMSA